MTLKQNVTSAIRAEAMQCNARAMGGRVWRLEVVADFEGR